VVAMQRWIERLVLAALALTCIALICALYSASKDRQVLCKHLDIPVKLVYEDRITAQNLIDACHIRNVHIIGADEFRKSLGVYRNLTDHGNVSV
jgi:hypothetical protein